jgi:beta-glucanase (GH16 family)
MRFFLYSFFLSINLFCAAQTVEDSFEGNGTISGWFGDDCELDTSFSNIFITGINTSETVLKYSDTGGDYSNVRFEVPINFNLSEQYTFTLKLYIPSNSISGAESNQISLKLQDGTIGAPWSTQSEIIKSVILDEWQTLSFDFKNDNFTNLDPNSINPTDRTDFNRVVLQINGEDNASKVVGYIDDFLYDGVLSEDNDSGGDPMFNSLVWSDEFEGSGAINSGNWFHQTQLPGGGSWYNGEIQHYTDRTSNTYISNGALHLVAKKETFTNQGVTKQYTSARLNSKFAFTYGKVEVRAILPRGVGTWPAIWMLGKNINESGAYWQQQGFGATSWPACGEIDIMEHWGSNQNFVQSAMHTPSSHGGTVNHGGQTISTASSAYHVYSLEWYPEKMVFKVDGIHHYTYNPEIKNSETWPYDAAQYILLNIAIQPSIAGSFTQSAMEIDYVRVYQEATASVPEVGLEEVQVYPNPLREVLTIKGSNALLGAKAILYNINGSAVKTAVINETTQTLDCANLTKGIYFLKVVSAHKVATFKIFKI